MSREKTNFLVQGSILAIAGVLVRIIGIIYRVPVNNIIGETGAAYYSAAYNVYSLFLLISSMSMPLAVSKIVSAKLAKGEIKNAYKAFTGAVGIGLVLGIFTFCLMYFGADFWAGLWGFPSAAPAIKVLAPVVFIMSVLGVLRGFFQGIGTMLPTAISQILEQVANAVVSIVGAMYLFGVGRNATESAMLGAAGSTMGTLAGAAVALIFLSFVFVIYLPVLKRQIAKNRGVQEEDYGSLSKELIMTIAPVLLSTTLYNLSGLFDSGVYGNICEKMYGIKEADYAAVYGVYSGHFKLLTTAPIAIASALSSAIIPSVIRSVMSGDRRGTIRKLESSMRLTMIVAIPAGMGLTVLAEPIIKMLFGNELIVESTNIMRFAVLTVVFYSMSTISNAFLQGIDKMHVPIINSAIAIVIHYVVLIAGLFVVGPSIYVVVVADMIYAFSVCILNSSAVYKFIRYKQEIIKTFVLPLVSAAIMGAVAIGVYYVMNLLVKSNIISCVIAILVACIVYCLSLLLVKGVSEEEINMLPKGKSIANVLKKTGLL